MDGACTASTCCEIALTLARDDAPTRTSRPSSSSTSHDRRGDVHRGACGTRSDGFYYDVLATPDGQTHPAEACARWSGSYRSLATTTLGPRPLERAARSSPSDALVPREPARATPSCSTCTQRDGGEGRLLSIVSPERLDASCVRLLDENEFLSPHGVRALSAASPRSAVRARPRRRRCTQSTTSPAESTTGLFGGNSNWRGPVWFPVNYHRDRGVRRYAPILRRRLHGRVPHRLRARRSRSAEVADELGQRLIDSSFTRRATAAGRCTAATRSSRPIPRGTTASCSTSTSTATPARASGHRTRPAGPAWLPTSSSAAVSPASRTRSMVWLRRRHHAGAGAVSFAEDSSNSTCSLRHAHVAATEPSTSTVPTDCGILVWKISLRKSSDRMRDRRQ